MQDQMIRAVDHPSHEQRTKRFIWCSACKQGFDAAGDLAFEFIRCPVCGAEPPAGFLPWSWVRAHWRNELPCQPELNVRYEVSPDSSHISRK